MADSLDPPIVRGILDLTEMIRAQEAMPADARHDVTEVITQLRILSADHELWIETVPKPSWEGKGGTFYLRTINVLAASVAFTEHDRIAMRHGLDAICGFHNLMVQRSHS